ncbi:MAG TPA: NAD(P)H-hydrate dehydratase, partial [Candidatus Udaeobacter sp.]|nr:NAD(P)H-hydrate dehydratase [Candidatus Udaeobacter sp.]
MDLPILTSAQMRGAEEAAFARGVQVEELMNKAGAGVAQVVTKFFQIPGRCIVFAGKGNNAGDALFAAQCLEQRGWKIEIRLAFKEADCSALMRKKLADLCRRPPEILGGVRSATADAVTMLVELSPGATEPMGPTENKIATEACSSIAAPVVILDGLLGVGAEPPLREPIRASCRAINQLRTTKGAYVFAVDLPTGLDTDSGNRDRDCVVADFTVTIGYAKPGLVADDAVNYVGRIEVVPLGELRPRETKPKEIIASPAAFRGLFPRRKYNSYKNQFGRIGVVAGSKGFVGAALMASQGALRAGAGLVEVFVPEEIYEIVAGASFMEAMVKPVASYRHLLKEKADVWAVGPGLGKSHSSEIIEFVEKAKQPMVLDADGLNIASEKTSVLRRCKGKRLLTPHPGEMKRLFPEEQETRAKTATKFCDRFPVTLLLKGSRTIVAERGRPLSYNTTGNPGMATGGMGDVLTGVCAGLLGQGLSPYDAARVGAWLCGRAAEIAIFNGSESEQSLLPRDVLDHLGDAFKE